VPRSLPRATGAGGAARSNRAAPPYCYPVRLLLVIEDGLDVEVQLGGQSLDVTAGGAYTHDITVEGDPFFNIAYRFGAVFLSEAYPSGAGRPDLAVALLEKGLRARPDKWEYMQDIGFVHYWWLHDYRAAAEWFDKASKVPNAPWFLRSLAAVTLVEGGDRSSSRQMWLAIRESAEIDWLKTDAERRLQQLDVADAIDELQRYIDAARPRTGAITSWQEAIRAGIVRGVPLDPAGVPLGLDHEGRVHVGAMSPLYPLPEEPQRASARP